MRGDAHRDRAVFHSTSNRHRRWEAGCAEPQYDAAASSTMPTMPVLLTGRPNRTPVLRREDARPEHYYGSDSTSANKPPRTAPTRANGQVPITAPPA